MELPKYKNHRNIKYLAWIRLQDCVIAKRKAEVAHHVNLGTNGGKGLKASDYFCIPLLSEFHTTGLWAVHGIGELSFLKTFKLNYHELFIYYLQKFLQEIHNIRVSHTNDSSTLEKIYLLISTIEENTASNSRTKKKSIKKAQPKNLSPKVKVSETPYYQKSKELKREYDKELRSKNKKKLSDYRKEQYKKAKEYQKRSSIEISSK